MKQNVGHTPTHLPRPPRTLAGTDKGKQQSIKQLHTTRLPASSLTCRHVLDLSGEHSCPGGRGGGKSSAATVKCVISATFTTVSIDKAGALRIDKLIARSLDQPWF